jgi:hypothetical protein
MTAEQVRLVRELRGDECRCGRAKKGGQTFCRSCYFKLEPCTRQALYMKMGAGYEQAYASACEELAFCHDVDAAFRDRATR